MLTDLQQLAAEGGSLESRGDSGETVVCPRLTMMTYMITRFSYCHHNASDYSSNCSDSDKLICLIAEVKTSRSQP